MKGHHFRATPIIRSFETRIDPNLFLFLYTSDHTYLFQSLERLLFADLDNGFLYLFRSFFIIIGTSLKTFALRFGIFHHQAQLVCAEFSTNPWSAKTFAFQSRNKNFICGVDKHLFLWNFRLSNWPSFHFFLWQRFCAFSWSSAAFHELVLSQLRRVISSSLVW